MKKEHVLWWVSGLLFALLVFGAFYSVITIKQAYEDGWKDGSKQSVNLIVERATDRGLVDLYDPISKQDITLIEVNYSQELCIKAIGGVFE
jgi:hypothetical protein